MKARLGYLPTLQATRALLKFCEDHPSEVAPTTLRKCLAALESGDFEGLKKTFKTFHFGAYGFTDWFPPVVFSHETPEYVQEVFVALAMRWADLMRGFLELKDER